MIDVRQFVGAAIVGLIFGLAGAWLGTQLFAPPDRPGIHRTLHARLHLHPDQVSRLDAMEAAYAARRRVLDEEVHAANAALATVIREETYYSPRVHAAIEHLHEVLARLQHETVTHVFAMREVLDSEQQVTFDEVVTDVLAEPR